MTITINRKQVLALTKIDLTGLGHLQKLNAIARAFGLRNQSTMMSLLKTQDQPPATPEGMYDIASLVEEIATSIIARQGVLILAGPSYIPLEDIADGLQSTFRKDEVEAEIISIRDRSSAHQAINLGRTRMVIGHLHSQNIHSVARRLLAADINALDAGQTVCGIAAMRALNPPYHQHTLVETVNVHGQDDFLKILARETFWTPHLGKAIEKVRRGDLDPDALFMCFGGQELSGYLPRP